MRPDYVSYEPVDQRPPRWMRLMWLWLRRWMLAHP